MSTEDNREPLTSLTYNTTAMDAATTITNNKRAAKLAAKLVLVNYKKLEAIVNGKNAICGELASPKLADLVTTAAKCAFAEVLYEATKQDLHMLLDEAIATYGDTALRRMYDEVINERD